MTALARRLERSHELAFWCPDTIREPLARSFPSSPVSSVPAMRIVMSGSAVDLGATAAANIPPLLSAVTVVSGLQAELDDWGPDGVLSDFEPFLPEAAARAGLPILQLNHPGIITRALAGEPRALAAKAVAASMMGRFDRLLISSFFDGDVGPIIRPEVLRAAASARRASGRGRDSRNGFILVYAREGLAQRFRDFAAAFPRREFRFFPDPARDYPAELASCAAIIAPAGHQTLSEALCLGKPIFSVPLDGQVEQELNASMLRRSGRGEWAPASSFEEPLERFLAGLCDYPKRPLPGTTFRFRDDGPRAARIVSSFFADAAKERRSATGPSRRSRIYSRVTWFMGRLVRA